ncbi:hypothetical protein MCUN1_000168 [Malassezia cuniculi]|uniref:Oxysterol-binding protein n=1 Tax=Malassezia cuniculi TaxID=948313 RepID=A0AAF0ENG7_9BASI|nr:hypothetical protein MCUN1_000168 [Malassezia cuniculi]
MGLFGMSSTPSGNKGFLRGSKEDAPPEGVPPEDVEELDEESGNILLSLISQLRIGMDLHKVTLPTFVLEPRSMLERITDFLSHPDIIFGAGREPDAQKRFLAVLTYYMSGWHIKPRGVKKPYNPVLGEFFRCSYDYPNGTRGFYIAEQVSHHPPISAYYYVSEANNLIIYGDIRPKSKFLGNSAATLMDGTSHVVFLDRLADGAYQISMPNMYARGILFGKMVMELGDTSRVENKNTNLSCDVEFKVKGYFTGSYNAISARVQRGNKTIGELSGRWSDVLEYKDSSTGKSSVMFDAKNAKFAQKKVAPISEQEPNESQRLWQTVTEGIKTKNMDLATEAKTKIEDAQRQSTREREERGQTWSPKYFALYEDQYIPKLGILPDEYRPESAISYFASILSN